MADEHQQSDPAIVAVLVKVALEELNKGGKILISSRADVCAEGKHTSTAALISSSQETRFHLHPHVWL